MDCISLQQATVAVQQESNLVYLRALKNQSHTVGTLSGLGAIVLWSTTFAFARSLSEQVGAWTAAAAVYLCGGVLCLIRLYALGGFRERFRKLSPKYLAGCGALFLLYTAVIYHAVGLAKNREQVLEIALVNYLWPAATILLSLPLLRRRASLLIWPGTALALLGVFMVMTQGSNVSWRSFQSNLESNPLPYILGLIAAISWGLYSNLARRWSTPDSPGGVELFVPATGVLLLLICLATAEQRTWNARSLSEALALGSITALAYALWDFAMRRGSLPLVAAVSYFTPVLSTIVSSIYLHVNPGPRLWIGCAFVVAGSLLSWHSVADDR